MRERPAQSLQARHGLGADAARLCAGECRHRRCQEQFLGSRPLRRRGLQVRLRDRSRRQDAEEHRRGPLRRAPRDGRRQGRQHLGRGCVRQGRQRRPGDEARARRTRALEARQAGRGHRQCGARHVRFADRSCGRKQWRHLHQPGTWREAEQLAHPRLHQGRKADQDFRLLGRGQWTIEVAARDRLRQPRPALRRRPQQQPRRRLRPGWKIHRGMEAVRPAERSLCGQGRHALRHRLAVD